MRAILGIGTGMSVYAVGVAAGLGELATRHPTLLDVVKLAGAAYLARLAWVTVRGAGQGATDAPAPGRPYARGVLVSLANPKVMLFFVSVLPQFLGDADDTRAQLALLGAVNVATEVLLYGTIGVLAGSVHARLRASRRADVTLARVAAAVYLVLAVVVATETLRHYLA